MSFAGPCLTVLATDAKANEQNRTVVSTLAMLRSTTELHPQLPILLQHASEERHYGRNALPKTPRMLAIRVTRAKRELSLAIF